MLLVHIERGRVTTVEYKGNHMHPRSVDFIRKTRLDSPVGIGQTHRNVTSSSARRLHTALTNRIFKKKDFKIMPVVFPDTTIVKRIK
jgi:hypothetical protein